MRRKLFWISFLLFASFTVSIFIFDRLYLLKQIDEVTESELETIASSIIASNLSIDVLYKFESTDDIIRDLLEDQRIDRSVRIFDTDGELVFNNDLAKDITEPYSKQTWSEIRVAHHRLKRLTINTGQYILEVGLFLDSRLVHTQERLNQILLVLSGILALATLIAFFASKVIMRPLNDLGSFFVNYNQRHNTERSDSEIAGDDIKTLQLLATSEDEVSVLARSLLTFLNKASDERSRRNNDLYFLAHELKTPLSHLVIGLESMRSTSAEPAQAATIERLLEICRNLSIFIKDYLRIASVRSANKEALNLSALRLDRILSGLLEKISSEDLKRINLNIASRITILAESHHIESLALNLISNALKYSSGEIEITVKDDYFEVRDRGAGFSEKSLEQIGKPFNRSGLDQSTGLGLTYCFEICTLYGWKISHRRENSQTIMSVQFSPDSIYESTPETTGVQP